ncbi:elongation factor 4 [Candidatus Poribacteria bacterium]|nr:elongation factor 4 [Candidatus Poribacteria bacterium]MYG05512.1 elongation factor 4 [Candidatus Poribacteria bacterium]MYK22030.1 elongation factor 4 [Candidatus Poribacteria bacterium]
MPTNLENIRNFCILGHIDHGKSTLSDRLLEHTNTLTERDMREQVLDLMDLERERGITIKATAVKLHYPAPDGNRYELNLIDTPGHVDFTYEVSRSLAACEGAILIVDAAQGVEAQTLANAYLAINNDLEIIPVVNKIDLPTARPDEARRQIEEVVGIPADDALLVSAKMGIGIPAILEAIVNRIPAPIGETEAPLKALVLDSVYDNYRGVIMYTRIFDGSVKPGEKIRLMETKRSYEVEEVGIFTPEMQPTPELRTGGVGYLIAGIREIDKAKIGDTITDHVRPTETPLPGYREMKPLVFSGLYPADTHQFHALREALDKLRLNDSSFNFEPETSIALGFGFRCGFLGLLHMEIIHERLEREFGLALVRTAPSVMYRVHLKTGEDVYVDNPAHLPEPNNIERIEEPYVNIDIIVPRDYIGNAMELCQKRRGVYKRMNQLDAARVQLLYELPLSEMLMDFYPKLKSLTRGYGSLEYDIGEYKTEKLVKLDVLLNGDPVDALSTILPLNTAETRGKALVSKLKELIPRQMFEVPVQAAIGNKIVARETVRALRKNVTAKCYGGDVSRKRKLLEKQKEGKKRLKQIGRVDVPQEAFTAMLATDE